MSLNQNLTQTLIYNPQDDYFYLNGVKTIYRGYQNAIPVFANGNFNIPVNNGSYSWETTWAGYVQPFAISGGNLVGSPDSSKMYSVTSDSAIDFTSRDSIEVTMNGAVHTLNVSDVSGSGYLYVGLVKYTSNTDKTLYIAVCSSKSNAMGSNAIKHLQRDVGTATTFNISSIIVQ